MTTAVAYGITEQAVRQCPRGGSAPREAGAAGRSRPQRPEPGTDSGGVVTVQTADGEIALEAGEYELVLETTGRPEGEALALFPGGGFVMLDTTTTPELEAEGLARDVIRAVQDTRKVAGFDVSDRIRLQLLFEKP